MLLTHPGLVCSVGLNAAAACAAMRAGIAGFADLPYRDNAGEPIVGAAVPDLGPELNREERLLRLLEGALGDCLKSAGFERTDSIPLLVGLSETGRPGGGHGLAGTVVERVQQRLGQRFHPTLSRSLTRGHTAGFELLGAAREMLQDPRIPCCIVAAADSYINAASLAWLDRHGRLKTLDNSDGVIPGEAGAAIVVERSADMTARSTAAELAGIGLGFERANILNEDPLLGLGLAGAAAGALAEAALGMHQIDLRLSDVTGESYGFKEQVLTLGRLMRQRREELPLWHVADCIGDVGAAAALCHCIVALFSWKKNYGPGPVAAVFGSSVPGERAVAILRAARVGEGRRA